VVSQLDVAAAGAATDIASADTTQISLRVEVCGAAADWLELVVAVAVRWGGHERRVGAVLPLCQRVVARTADAATARVVRWRRVMVPIVDKDGAATALDPLTTLATTTTKQHD